MDVQVNNLFDATLCAEKAWLLSTYHACITCLVNFCTISGLGHFVDIGVFGAMSKTNSSGYIQCHEIVISSPNIVAHLIIAFNCASMIIIGLVLCHRALGKRNRLNGHQSLFHQQHKNALCEMIPLLMYSVLSVLTPV